jgi:uncharacterized protein (DUF1330 family)
LNSFFKTRKGDQPFPAAMRSQGRTITTWVIAPVVVGPNFPGHTTNTLPGGAAMSAYAIAHIQSITIGPAIVEYLERIDATLAPYRGRFVVHGDPADIREGDFVGDVVAIEFPSKTAAVGWYESAAYREIAPLRTENSRGWVILIDAVPSDHRATDILTSTAEAA